MTDHPSADTLRRLLRGRLAPDELLEIDDHVAACAACRAAMSRPAATESVRDAIAGEHLQYEQIEAYIDGNHDREPIEQHLRLCPPCALEVEDLQRAARDTRPQRWTWWAAAAAAILVVISAATLFRREEPPAPRPSRPIARPAPAKPTSTLDPALARVLAQLASGTLPSAELVEELRPAAERIRGSNGAAAASLQVLAPMGVVESDAPLFRWTSRRGATFVVEVFDASYRRIARSGELRRAEWRPGEPLPRGAIHSWQVTETRGETRTVAPAPPAPPARFRIIGDAAVAELAAARAANDHLAMALVYAREGAVARALDAMALAQKESPESGELRAAIRTLRRYHPAPTTTNPPQ